MNGRFDFGYQGSSKVFNNGANSSYLRAEGTSLISKDLLISWPRFLA